MKKRKFKAMPLLMSALAVLGCTATIGTASMIASPTKVYAASTGNWYIQNLMVYEATTHTPTINLNNASEYSENNYVTTGITVYSPSNTGNTYTSNGLRVSSNSFYIDFTNANQCRYPVSSDDGVAVDTKYQFNVYNSSGSLVFYERFSATSPINANTMTQTYSGVGVNTKSITLTNDNQSVDNAKVDPKYYGKRNLYLSDGNYSIEVVREYVWLNSKNAKAIYTATSKATASLLVDGTAPSVNMKDSSSNTVSNGAYTNKNVTVTATDKNLYGLFYKKPGSSSYSYTASTFTTSGENGWYYFYAKDNVYTESDVYSFYLDTVLPTGSIKNGSTTLSSGGSTSNAFSYVAVDNGSGVANVYYKAPGSSSYTSYTSGSIIPNTAGDGWYYFYCVDKAGNVSATSSIRLDTTKPNGNLFVDGSSISSGSYTNKDFKYIASDSSSGVSGVYVKKPGSSSYVSYTNGSVISSGSGDGWYYFYSKDAVGNISETASVLLDTTKPNGFVSSGGTRIANGSYISGAFTYNATDDGSGISKIYYKSPITGSFVEYSNGSIIPNTAGDGWYEFYAIDRTGNISDTTRIYLETSQPLVNIYRNDSVAFSVSMTNGGTYDTGIYFNRNDIMKITCDTSSGNISSNYVLNSNYVLDESYGEDTYTISITTATGIKSSFIYHIIDENPYLVIDSKRYESGTTLYFNKDILVNFGVDSIQSNDSNTGITINGIFYSYSELSSKNLTTDDNSETTYNISLNDRAGNVSYFTIVIDKENPSAIWKDSNGQLVGNDSYTNKDVKLVFEEFGVSAKYSYNGSEYEEYTSGTTFTQEGKYIVVISDLAGNKSYYNITIDKTNPTGKFYSNYVEVNNGTITNGKVYFTWEEDCTATINGIEYVKNTVISEEGVYEFVLTDKAGNKSTYNIEIDLTCPTSNKDNISSRKDYTVSKWYNVSFGDKTTSFATYEEALNYACALEFNKYVTVLELDDVSKFTQTHLIGGGEIHEGTYYRYKSKSSASNELYYFDEASLYDVIETYAKEYLSTLNYYNLESNNIGEIGNDFMYSNTWTCEFGCAPLINGYKFNLDDSNEIYAHLKGENGWNHVESGVAFEEQFHTTGVYEIKEIDAAGNVTIYDVFLDLSSPDLEVKAEVFGEDSYRDLIISEEEVSTISAYYYKSFDLKAILDNDPYATISITNNGVTNYYSNGDALPTLCDGGKYDITVYDRLNNNYSFTVYIVGNEADVSFINNNDNTAFNVDITLEQDFDAIVSLEIYKDGVKLDGISTDVTHYTFEKDGTYKVVIKDNFGRIVERTYKFDKSLPNGFLSCQANTKTNDNVSFTYDNTKYYVEVYKDGVLIDTDYLGAVSYSNDGDYSIKLINLNDVDNINTYSFVIDKTSPNVDVTGCEEGKVTNGNVSISWEDSDVESATYSVNNGEPIQFENGTTFTQEGAYVITIKDDLGNTSTKTFTIDKSLDYEVHDLSGIAEQGTDMTTSGNVVISNNEELHIDVTMNGQKYDYTFGDSLYEEGKYEIRIYDDFGNSSTFTVIIDKSVDYYSNVSDAGTTSEDVYFVSGEKATIIVTKDGNPYSYSWGDKITEEGCYTVTMYDSYGNEKTMTFTIDKSVDYVANVENGDGTNEPVVITSNENVDITVEKNGEVIEYAIGDQITEDGTYVVTITDEFGNEESFSFVIDTSAPEVTLNGISDGGKENTTVTITDMTEEGEIHVYKDGNEIDYELGQEIKEYGNYKIVVTDKLGNARTYTFELAYQVNGAVIALIGVGIALVAGVVVLIIMKKKRVFKK